MNVNCYIGRIGNDLELKYTNSNKAVISFNLAVQKGYGENKRTIWIPVTAWEKTAEFISKYMQKGSNIAIVGELDQRTWEDNDGKKHSKLEVVAKNVFFAGDKKEGQQQGQQQGQQDTFNPEEYAIDNSDELPF